LKEFAVILFSGALGFDFLSSLADKIFWLGVSFSINKL
jgi:hypothetical protein